MSLTEMLLPEFDESMRKTRRVLERVPEDRFEWTPHAKSMSMIRLAGHLSSLPQFGLRMMNDESFDVGATGGNPLQRVLPATTAELVAEHDRNVAALRAAIAAADDAHLMQPWSIKNNGQVIFELPRIAMLRGMLLDHITHHRGQMTVYLRINDIPLPSLFGPSADEAL